MEVLAGLFFIINFVCICLFWGKLKEAKKGNESVLYYVNICFGFVFTFFDMVLMTRGDSIETVVAVILTLAMLFLLGINISALVNMIKNFKKLKSNLLDKDTVFTTLVYLFSNAAVIFYAAWII